MAGRWIVDVDGRGLCAVAMEEGGRCFAITEPMPREQCEQHIQSLRDSSPTTRTLSAEHLRLMQEGRQRAREERDEERRKVEAIKTGPVSMAEGRRVAAGKAAKAARLPRPPKRLPATAPEGFAVPEKKPRSKPTDDRGDELYADGYYRVPCAECGRGIRRSGKPGRQPHRHEECP